jgi:hypothetical protein
MTTVWGVGSAERPPAAKHRKPKKCDNSCISSWHEPRVAGAPSRTAGASNRKMRGLLVLVAARAMVPDPRVKGHDPALS